MEIKIIKNWPYKVTWNIPLDTQVITNWDQWEPVSYTPGKSFDLNDSYSLCRCWKSFNKPFCDWTHFDVSFDGSETADLQIMDEESIIFEWEELDLIDKPKYCVKARFCHPDHWVWRLTRESWDLVSREKALKESFLCPSWRLTHTAKDWKEIRNEYKEEISLIQDPAAWVSWPIWVKWGIDIISSEWKRYAKKDKVTLCRCGHSWNKPLCDGSHMNSNWNDGTI